ncbi:hypothetical protein [Asticcacaulis endophyticus]|uniref:Uncharacterized protein n=1 Tax=Asticcacaulis endophyticus TaxID=1395890 RepID=A0A918UMV7_9CAUL|nr:hypothetical protein [Asticcacaulis endophyticus]GGZ21959.1 hypothetical protein GCM10011273_03450 [Asticcacaulis endophyticus]
MPSEIDTIIRVIEARIIGATESLEAIHPGQPGIGTLPQMILRDIAAYRSILSDINIIAGRVPVQGA